MPITDTDPANWNATPMPADPHGQAALVLVESLIHGLCENSTISTDEALAITRRAAHVQHDRAKAADGAGAPLWSSHGLLLEIATSLEIDSHERAATPNSFA